MAIANQVQVTPSFSPAVTREIQIQFFADLTNSLVGRPPFYGKILVINNRHIQWRPDSDRQIVVDLWSDEIKPYFA